MTRLCPLLKKVFKVGAINTKDEKNGVESCSMKRKEILSCATKCKKREDIMLSDQPVTEGQVL